MSYRKGVFYERELLHFLDSKGMIAIRMPSSGGAMYPLDVLAMKSGLLVAIEAKAWSKKPRLPKDRVKSMREWCDKAGAIGFLGWRTRGKWLFLKLEDVENKNYDDDNWMEMDSFLELIGVSVGDDQETTFG